jgi:hypothetical protein
MGRTRDFSVLFQLEILGAISLATSLLRCLKRHTCSSKTLAVLISEILHLTILAAIGILKVCNKHCLLMRILFPKKSSGATTNLLDGS